MGEKRGARTEMGDVNRRNFLKNASAAGGIAGFGLLPHSRVQPTKRVPKYLHKGKVVEWMDVPREWLRHEERAEKIKQRLERQLLKKDNVLAVGLTNGEKQFGRLSGSQPKVYADQSKSTNELPDSADGLLIKTEKVPDDYFKKAGCYNTNNFSNYRGGCFISDDSEFPGSSGTTGYPVKKGGTAYMLSAQHIFQDCGWNDTDITYQKDWTLGYTKRGSVSGDYIATTVIYQGADIANKILEPDGTKRTVSGYASKKEIKRRDNDLWDGYTQMGTTTGKTTGGIFDHNIAVTGCNDLRGEGFIGGADGAPGDSGGPMYSIENGDAFILGHLTYVSDQKSKVETCGGGQVERHNYTTGFPAYEVANDGFQIGI